VLINGGHGKEGEDQDKDKYIVDAERFFDQVAGKKCQCGFMIGIPTVG
jgi:hypothetical protein